MKTLVNNAGFRPCCGVTWTRASVGRSSAVALAAALLSLATSCGDDEDQAAATNKSKTPLVIVTERESPDTALQYLHILDEWPANGQLDDGNAVEIGEFPAVRAGDGAVFVYHHAEATLEKFVLDEGVIRREDPISFSEYGVHSFNAELMWYAPERAFLVDEDSGQIIRFDPSAMVIQGTTDVDPALLEREGKAVQFQQGVCTADRCYTAINYRDWENYEVVPGVRLGWFDPKSDSPTIQVIEDDRCAVSQSISPFADEDGNVYVVGDGGLGFDLLANPNKTTRPQCVLRVRKGQSSFDPSFFVDLQEATGSPGFYTAHPMQDQRLLLNLWSPDVNVADAADPVDPNWYWDYPPYFEWAIVDLKEKTSTPLALERAAVQFSVTLRVDGLNYVLLYRQDGGAAVHEVSTDGTLRQMLDLGMGTDVQYLGRL